MQKSFAPTVLFLLALPAFSQNWFHAPSLNGRDLNCVKIFNRDIILAAGGWRIINPFQTQLTQTLYKSFNSCLQWNVYLDNDGGWFKSVEFIDDQKGFIVGWDGVIFKTDDSGEHWTPVTSPVSRHFNRIFIIDSLAFIIVGGMPADSTQGAVQTILKSVNGGQSWSVITDQPGFFLKAVYFFSPANGIAVGDSGTILKSADAGNTWTPVASPIIRNFNSVWFSNPNNGIIVGGNETNDSIRVILRTIDGGDTWTVIKDELGGWLMDVTFVDADTGYAVGDRATVLKTIDGGQAWSPISVPGTSGDEYFNAVRFNGWDYGFIAGKWADNYIYNHEPPPLAYTMGAEEITPASALMKANVNSLSRHARYSFVFSNDFSFSSPSQTIPSDFRNDVLMPVQFRLGWLSPNTTYYYFISAWTIGGRTNGDTLSFYTGDPTTNLMTQPATEIAATTASINGTVHGFSETVNLYFQYGLTPDFGSVATASPATVADTFEHAISANISSLQPNSSYYFRLVGESAFGNRYGNTHGFFTGAVYSVFQTLAAQSVTDTSAVISVTIEGFKIQAYLNFEYSANTPGFDSIRAGYPRAITDTLRHVPNLTLNSLQPGTLYFFRMKAITTLGNYYSDTGYFYTITSDTNLLALTATEVTSSSAKLNGKVSNYSQPVSVSFEYGETPLLGNVIPGDPVVVNGPQEQQVSAAISGLQGNTLYYYRIAANIAGTKLYGGQRQFYTGNPIPNWDFADWESKTVLLPDYWNIIGETFERVAGNAGNYALKLFKTNFAFLGKFVLDLSGGVPFTSRPDSFYVNMNYNIDPGDTALVGFVLRRDTAIAGNIIGLNGNSGSQFQRITYPISYNSPLAPDSVVIGLGMFSQSPGSHLIIDEAGFIPEENVLNADFESWYSYHHEEPAGWNYPAYTGIDTSGNNPPMVSKEIFNQPDDYAASVRNLDLGGGTYLGGNLSNQTPQPIDLPLLTFPVQHRHQTLNGLFKYEPDGNDTMLITVSMYRAGLPYGAGVFKYGAATNGYSTFEADIIYNDESFVPDAALISLTCSKGRPAGLSQLTVDKLSFDGFSRIGGDDTTSIAENNSGAGFQIFPNPASSVATILLQESLTGNLEICNMFGERIHASSFSGKIISLNVSGLEQGIYLLRIAAGREQMISRLVVIR